ncbi:gamma-glutamylcyclotransferase [Verminephrobacter aporrectodeae subsp. tuberculatae]|uniref:Gamma-glutamylcyclotransferase n=1 Tax=Verminephrobacter aporrectodeae subsp. tuberculatae TaxID=1110392 RepID=A0ABT3KZ22_9BURK|nr:gamma-glutamylcyclotransferase family protein [Verminephrobacter aporrectodeae]MCW5257611.1 gamma-glutamylcyclotransferase [Verminephrobacter aporrectodeae subsp. tuberculatae]MCW5323601.1 gamma-glutamylcyclotransferase [Verminephrobacter aporrectodeae subsp. tuberculatae]
MPDESHPARPSRCVFVYGTLRCGGSNDITRLRPAPRFVGAARVAGALHHLGAYPGMTLGGSGWVRGEVYAIAPALEALLDEIEDLGAEPTDEYVKREVVVQLEGQAQALPCLVYEINPRRLGSAPLIAHGDWLGEGNLSLI